MKSVLGGVGKKKPNFDKEVQDGYLAAINKMIPIRDEAAIIRHQINIFVNDKSVSARPQTIEDRARMQHNGEVYTVEDHQNFISW